MPWVLSAQMEHLSSSPSQRQCEQSAFSFYCAVREQLPVWLLEDMRTMEVFCWEDGHPRAFLPSKALLYALVHDHQDYARYLLHRMIVETLRDCEVQSEWKDYLERCGGCSHVADSGKTAVQLAVELSRPDCLLLLLVHGAQADCLDAALQRLVSCDPMDRRHAQRCLDFLLLFMPKPLAKQRLQEEPQHWQSLLGNEVFSWLCGQAPPPLLLQSLRCLARSGPDQISALPNFLQPHCWH